MDQGGALIVMGEAGLKNSKKHLQRIALEFGGMVSLSMMQIIFMQRGVLGKGLFDADYAMYLKRMLKLFQKKPRNYYR